RFQHAWATTVPVPGDWAGARLAPAPPVGVPMPQAEPLVLDVDPRRVRLVAGGRAIASDLGGLIAHATARVAGIAPYISVASPSARALLARLTDARKRGADVRILLGRSPVAGALGGLGETGLEVRAMGTARGTTGHAKGLVVDDVAVVMSANWSATGLAANFE